MDTMLAVGMTERQENDEGAGRELANVVISETNSCVSIQPKPVQTHLCLNFPQPTVT